MSVRRAQAEIDADEFEEWQAFHRVEPFGDWWRGVGEVCATVVRMVGGMFGKPKCYPEDWMPGQMKESLRLRQQGAGQMESAMRDVEWAERLRS